MKINPSTLYQATIQAILSLFLSENNYRYWRIAPQFIGTEEWIDHPFTDLFWDLINGQATYLEVLPRFWQREEVMPSLDLKTLQKMLPFHLPSLMLKDIWQALLLRQFERDFLYLYEHSEYLYSEVTFEGVQLDRFAGSQLLYPYFLEVDNERERERKR